MLSPSNPKSAAVAAVAGGAKLEFPEEEKELNELWREHQTSKLKGRGIHRRTKPFHRSRPGETFVSRSHGQLAAIYMEDPGGVWTHLQQQPREEQRPDGEGEGEASDEAARDEAGDEAACGAEKAAVEKTPPVQPASAVPQPVAVLPPPSPPPSSSAGASVQQRVDT
jgi:hypothetical protein